jgi:MinD-like ATPase involved in chromosome partitioning or flagellar assembly
VNRGVPFVISHPDSPLSRDITQLARTLAGAGSAAISKTDKTAKRGLFARR